MDHCLQLQLAVTVAVAVAAVSYSSFIDWLQSQNKRNWTIKEIKNYAIKYGRILDTADASELMTLSLRNKHHAMEA